MYLLIIYSYRLERIKKINMLKDNSRIERNIIHDNIIYAVDIQRRAMKFVSPLNNIHVTRAL